MLRRWVVVRTCRNSHVNQMVRVCSLAILITAIWNFAHIIRICIFPQHVHTMQYEVTRVSWCMLFMQYWPRLWLEGHNNNIIELQNNLFSISDILIWGSIPALRAPAWCSYKNAGLLYIIKDLTSRCYIRYRDRSVDVGVCFTPRQK